MEALGLTAAAEVDINTLAGRLSRGLRTRLSPMMIGAFARKPFQT
jgi:hypothetical protein